MSAFNVGDVIVAHNRTGIIIKKYFYNSTSLFEILWSHSFDNSSLVKTYSDAMIRGFSKGVLRK